MKVAIVHYWFVGMGGGEKVVEAFLELYPDADVFTLIEEPKFREKLLNGRPVKTSFLQRIPFAAKFHRHLLPLMPMALENLDLTGYDLVISSESGPAKGVLPALGATHVCYCHSPMRYIWDQYWEYRRSSGLLARLFMGLFITRLRLWDHSSAARVDHFVANSSHIANRIGQYYRRDAAVIHPPVDTDAFAISDELDDYYLVTGRHVGYKRVDLAIQACERLGRPLVITGLGPDTAALKKLAGPNVRFVGQCSFEDLKRYYARARAFLMPGEEDFGIAPVEAMASGRPVLALARGGALDTVIDGKSGILFAEQSVDGLCAAIERFEQTESLFDPRTIRDHAQTFSRERFAIDFAAFVEKAQRLPSYRTGQTQ